jgi:hypothetical protein
LAALAANRQQPTKLSDNLLCTELGSKWGKKLKLDNHLRVLLHCGGQFLHRFSGAIVLIPFKKLKKNKKKDFLI